MKKLFYFLYLCFGIIIGGIFIHYFDFLDTYNLSNSLLNTKFLQIQPVAGITNDAYITNENKIFIGQTLEKGFYSGYFYGWVNGIGCGPLKNGYKDFQEKSNLIFNLPFDNNLIYHMIWLENFEISPNDFITINE